MKYKGVCFDLDQTLCNTEDYLLKALEWRKDLDQTQTVEYIIYIYLKDRLKVVSWKEFFEVYERSKDEIKELLKGKAASHNRYLYFQRTFENLGMKFDSDLVLSITNLYWSYIIDNITLFPNVNKILSQCKGDYLKIAIISDLTADIQMKKMKKIGIDEYIDFLVTSEEAGSDKPDIKQMELALKKMELKKEDVLVVGNNPKTDIELANRFGVDSVLFDFYGRYSKEECNCTYYINNFIGLRKILGLRDIDYSNDKLLMVDLIGTLTDEPHVIRNNLSRSFNLDYSVAKPLYEKLKIGEISREEFWKKLGFGEEWEMIERQFLDGITINIQSIEWLKRIRDSFLVILFSNFSAYWVDYIIDKYDIKDIFDDVIVSEDIKYAKPSREIFDIVFHKYPNIWRKNIFLVDDTLENLSTARDFSVTPVWYRREDSQNCNYIPDIIVNSLEETEKYI